LYDTTIHLDISICPFFLPSLWKKNSQWV